MQNFRRSQFVLTYGPGSIIETKKGPRIIPSLKNGLGLEFGGPLLEKNEILDSRIGSILNNGESIRVFEIPSNSRMGKSEKPLYITNKFPAWKICYKPHGSNGHPIIYDGRKHEKCPLCREKDGLNTGKDDPSIRFITACRNGHLDEVPWGDAVHNLSKIKKGKCNHDNSYFTWIAGNTFSTIFIRCPICGAETNMESIYQAGFKCKGRKPENEWVRKGKPSYVADAMHEYCNGRAKVMQRQSSSLRIPETITLLTIPVYDQAIYRVLNGPGVLSNVGMALEDHGSDKEDFLNFLGRHMKNKPFQGVKKCIEEYKFEEFKNFYYKLNNPDISFMDYMYEEFEALSIGSCESEDGNFMVGKPVDISGNEYLPDFQVYPVEKIKTVTAQTGYYRMPYSKDDTMPPIVDIGQNYEDDRWYPGFVGIGEGIFLRYNLSDILEKIACKKAYPAWKSKTNVSEMINTRWTKNVTNNPAFVWLHTLSHSLIKSIALYSGYSAASIQERVYLNGNLTGGGILLYVTMPGEDGGMGGLVSVAKNKPLLNKIFELALDNLIFCSNDPLCSKEVKNENRVNGAACHSCLLVSETSCEHRNMWLDRNIVMGE
ncbi:DUF1998 domain-containing protein [Methanococcus maripaludis]|nr:DUF1998 domain-containing protein [Methanococcus maripaludis]